MDPVLMFALIGVLGIGAQWAAWWLSLMWATQEQRSLR